MNNMHKKNLHKKILHIKRQKIIFAFIFMGELIVGILCKNHPIWRMIFTGVLIMIVFIQSYRANRMVRQNKEFQEITARYEALCELSGIYFWQIDIDGNYTYISPEVNKVIGYEVEDMVGKNYQNFIYTENYHREIMKMEKGEILKNHEILHYRKDGGLLWVKVDAMPIYGDKGQIIAYHGTSTDIESQKQLEITLINAKNEIELAYYQAQIGPHFLYNALNAIAMYCLTEPKKASDLITDLSFFLRKSYDFKCIDYQVTLGQELELITAYVNIEKVRFQNRLQVHFDIKEEYYLQLLPPLILQPLIENAINHGLMKRIKGGTINVRVISEDTNILFEVQDDGIGIQQEKIDELRSIQERLLHANGTIETDFQKQGVGLKNIHSRLIMMYQSGLNIFRNESGGTTVFFRLPRNGKEEKSD